VAVENQTPATRTTDELRAYMDEVWRSSTQRRPGRSIGWLLRHVLTIGLVHAAALIVTYFLLLLGDALFTGYALVLRDAVFVSYVAQLGWLQRMSSDVKGAIAFVVALSALVQMLLFTGRVFIARE
jgi:hypothetical protein